MDKVEHQNKKSINRNISYNAILSIISYVFSAFMVLYVSRVLRPEIYGRVSFAGSVVSWFLIFSNMGIPIYALRECAGCGDDRKRLSQVFSELFSFEIILSVISFLILVLSCFLVPAFQPGRSIIIILGSNLLLQAIGCDWFYKSQEEFKYLAITSFVIKILAVTGMLIFVKKPEDVNIYALFSVISAGGIGVCNFLRLKRFVDIRPVLKPTELLRHIKPILIFFFMSCATTVYGNIDVIMLGFMKPEMSVGIYGLVSKSKMLLAFLGGVIWTAALPKTKREWEKGQFIRFQALVSKSISLVSVFNISLMAFCFLYAKELILFMGGNEYLGGVTAFRITVLSLSFIGLSNILGGQILIPTGNEKLLMLAEVIGAITNFILNLIFIPLFSIEGAAITTFIAELVVWGICYYFCIKNLKDVNYLKHKRELFPNPVIIPAVIISLIVSYVFSLVVYKPEDGFSSIIYMLRLFLCMGLVGIIYYVCFIFMAGIFNERTARRVLRIIKLKLEWICYKIEGRNFSNDSSAVYCPCCNMHFKGFIDGGFDQKPELYNVEKYKEIDQHVICPLCGSLPRHRILVSWMKEHIEEIRGKEILLFAQEKAVRTWLDRNKISYMTADLYNEADMRINLMNTGLRDNSAEIIICNHVLEHVSSYEKALIELHRILADNGMLILSFPVDNNLETVFEGPKDEYLDEKEKIQLFGQSDHLRVFGRDSEELLRNYGFKVEVIRGESFDDTIRTVTGPADYDVNFLYMLVAENI
ncbi:MAG: oligosaccharide flippase family protein [Eubacterium sp.]|nr:oligosaccharide flippase family protein [Eubacterium sp.]